MWKNFNEFLIKLDILPIAWEERISLYCVFLVQYTTVQSATVRSYVSAIKKKLAGIGYRCDDDLIWLASLTRACKIKNDSVRTRFPIKRKLLDCLLFETERKFAKKDFETFYNKTMLLALLLTAYFAMLRIGEFACAQGERCPCGCQ